MKTCPHITVDTVDDTVPFSSTLKLKLDLQAILPPNDTSFRWSSAEERMLCKACTHLLHDRLNRRSLLARILPEALGEGHGT